MNKRKRGVWFWSVAMLLLTMACSSDNTVAGDPDYGVSQMLTATLADGSNMYFVKTGATTVAVSYDHKNLTFLSEDNKPQITTYKGDVIVPSTVTIDGTTYTVNAVGEMAFTNCTQLTSVTLPESVSSLGLACFSNCQALTTVNIPSQVTEIPRSAFINCRALTSVVLPAGIKTIGNKAFWGCRALTSFDWPAALTEIDDYMFYYCQKLTSVTLPEGLTRIGCNAFYMCRALTSLTIPSTCLEVGDSAFYSCRALTSLSLPEGMTRIGDATFYECQKLTSLTVPATVTAIGSRALYDCRAMTTLTLPEGLLSIGDECLYDARKLDVTIPSTVTEIGAGCFNALISGDKVYVVKSVHMKSVMPPTAKSELSNRPETIALYVPTGAKAVYEADDYWKQFTNMTEE